MLSQLSKRINHILQAQDYPTVETPRTQQRNQAYVDRSKLSIQQSGGYSSERKEKLPPRSNSKQHIPPKSAYDVLNNSAMKSDRQPNDPPSNRKRPSIKDNQQINILPTNFIQIYKDEIMSLIKPFITELQNKITRRLEQIQKQIKSIMDTQKYEAMTLTQTPAFMSHSKSFNLSQDDSQVAIILRKAQLIALKIEDNQIHIMSKFRQVDQQIRQIRQKKPQRCHCMHHLQNLMQNQQNMYDQIQLLSDKIIHT